MKSPGTASAKTSGKKAKAAGSKSGGKFPTPKQERHQYRGEARREDASARREEADAAHRRAEAAHYQQEAAKAEREGHKGEATYDLAKARREDAEARRDMARARHNEAKARRNRHKAARVGLAVPGAISDRWILGGNGWHQGCAAVALANHLYAATGLRVSDGDVLGLYRLTADDPAQGASIQATLEAAAEYGLRGMRPASFGPANCGLATRPSGAVRIARRHQAAADQSVPILLDLRLQQAQRHQPVWDWAPSADWGAHAGLLASDRVITWGREVPVTGDFLARQVAGAWRVEWPSAMLREPHRPAPACHATRRACRTAGRSAATARTRAPRIITIPKGGDASPVPPGITGPLTPYISPR